MMLLETSLLGTCKLFEQAFWGLARGYAKGWIACVSALSACLCRSAFYLVAEWFVMAGSKKHLCCIFSF